jgi:excisionase family DNA binding protein
LSERNHNHPEKKRAYRVDEAVAAYGISRSTIYNLIKSGTLPDVRVSGRRLLPADALEALIAGNKH